MVETVHTPKTCMSTIEGDMVIIDFMGDAAIAFTDDTVSEAEGLSIMGSYGFLFWR